MTFTGTVATFTDSNPLATRSNATSVIGWGDGHYSNGTISGPDANGVYTVTGSYTYSSQTSPPAATPGGVDYYPVTVMITDPSGQSATSSGKAEVTSQSISANGVTFGVTPGVAFSGTVATFTDTNPVAAPSRPVAEITWGDGHAGQGTVTGPDANGVYNVTGTNLYASGPGPFTVLVNVTDPNGVSGTATSMAQVTIPAINLTSTNFAATPGVPFTAAVATFTDSNPLATRANTTAVINWGDGNSSNATIGGPDAGGIYTITGSYAYSSQNPPTLTNSSGVKFYPVMVTVTDPTGVSAVDKTGQAEVTSQTIAASGVTFGVTAGVTFTGPVATFIDTNAQAATTKPTAEITWGDGHQSQGTVTGPDANGVFTVTGTNTYLPTTSTNYAVTVTITDPTVQPPAPVMASSTAKVSVASLTAIATTFAVTPGVAFTGTVATFTDLNPAAVTTKPTVAITWGDGHESQGTVTGPDASGTFTITGTNTYSISNQTSYNVKVTITDPSGEQAPPVTSMALVTIPTINASTRRPLESRLVWPSRGRWRRSPTRTRRRRRPGRRS